MNSKRIAKNIRQITVLFLALLCVMTSGIYYMNAQEKTAKEKELIGFCGTNSFPSEEKTIFKNNCAACHKINIDLVGPKLGDVFSRIPSENWFANFIRNEDSLVQIKDKYALEINQFSLKFDWSHNFDFLSESDIQKLAAYIKNENNK